MSDKYRGISGISGLFLKRDDEITFDWEESSWLTSSECFGTNCRFLAIVSKRSPLSDNESITYNQKSNSKFNLDKWKEQFTHLLLRHLIKRIMNQPAENKKKTLCSTWGAFTHAVSDDNEITRHRNAVFDRSIFQQNSRLISNACFKYIANIANFSKKKLFPHSHVSHAKNLISSKWWHCLPTDIEIYLERRKSWILSLIITFLLEDFDLADTLVSTQLVIKLKSSLSISKTHSSQRKRTNNVQKRERNWNKQWCLSFYCLLFQVVL